MVERNPEVTDLPGKIKSLNEGDEKYVYLVEDAFDDLPEGYVTEHVDPSETKGLLSFVIWDHIQGIGLWNDSMLITTDQTKDGRAKIGTIDRSAMETSNFYLGPKGYPHGGGCQALGDLGVVAFETDDYSESHVQTYEMSGDTIIGEGFSIERDTKGAGSAGATHFPNEDKHLLAVADNGDLDLYEVDDLGRSGSSYTNLDCSDTIESGNNVNLVTDTDGTVYLVNPFSKDSGTTFGDYVEVYEVDLSGGSASLDTKVDDHHITTNYPWYIVAKLGVHCRYAAGMDLQNPDNPGRLVVTMRNFKDPLFSDPWLCINYLDP